MEETCRVKFKCRECGAERVFDIDAARFKRWSEGFIEDLFPELQTKGRQFTIAHTCPACRDNGVSTRMKPLMIGGVLRCCAETLKLYMQNGGTDEEGTYLPCRWCNSGLIVKDGAWRWPGLSSAPDAKS